MGLVLLGVAVAAIGGLLAANTRNIATRAASMNARLGGLYVNSRPSTWRFVGWLWVAVGLPLAIWAGLSLTH